MTVTVLNVRFAWSDYRNLQQENKRLEEDLGCKDKEIEHKDKELTLERSLWKSRDRGGADKNWMLRRIEIFDGSIGSKTGMYDMVPWSEEDFLKRYNPAQDDAKGE